MSEPNGQSDSAPKDSHDVIPLAPASASETSRPVMSPLGGTADVCPNCGKSVPGADVVCMNCGYDFQANRVVQPDVGIIEVEPPAKAVPDEPEFMRSPLLEGATTLKVLMWIGIGITLAAAVTAASMPPRGSGMGASVALFILTVYRCVLHTATGVAALWLASRWFNERLTRLEFAGVRMLVCVGVFYLLFVVRLPLESDFLASALKLPVAAAAYWVCVLALIVRDRKKASLLALFHLGTWGFVEIGIEMAVWLQVAAAGSPK